MLMICCIASLIFVVQEPVLNDPVNVQPVVNDPVNVQPVVNDPVNDQPGLEEPVIPDRQWRTPAELDHDLASIVSSNDAVTITTIGYSRKGQPIRGIQVARDGKTPIEDRSAVLLVAGIDGDHLLGSEVAVDMIKELLSRDPEDTKILLEDHVLLIIPQVNPDAANMYFAPIQNGHRRNLRPDDHDRDGLIDEDGGDDLNGDGMITMMRVPDLEKATHLSDPENERLDIKPDALEGQATAYYLLTEGIDNDGDGEYNEDGVGGVDLNKNFMHGYEYHGDGAGPWQLSEPESKALIDYVLDHQHIATIIVYGIHDTLSKPWGESGKDPAGAPKKLDSGDVDLYKKISERFVELTELKNVEQSNWNGSFVAWAYAQFGVPAFSTPLWSRPEPVKEESKDKDSDDQDVKPETDQDVKPETDTRPQRNFRRDWGSRPSGGGRPGRGMRPGRGGSSSDESASNDKTSSDDSNLTPSGVGDISQETLDELLQAAEAAGFPITDEMMADMTPERVERFAKRSGIKIRRVKLDKKDKKTGGDEAKWLTYSDEQRDGAGFVEWTSFEHPQLGTVEIGGWVPYFKTLPPTEVIAKTTKVQADFILDLAGRLPSVHLGIPIIKELGKGLWEIKIAVTNDGWFPSGTAMAKRNKRARPYVVRLEVPNDSVITGQKINRIWSLNGGGTRKWYRWIIQGKPNTPLNIVLFSEKFGSETITTELQDTNGGDV